MAHKQRTQRRERFSIHSRTNSRNFENLCKGVRMENFDLSKNLPYRCKIENCEFNKIVFADPTQFKRHLHLDHDYKELLQTAFENGIIQSLTEYRGHEWLVNKISDACFLKEEIV